MNTIRLNRPLFTILVVAANSLMAQEWSWVEKAGESLELKHSQATVWKFNYGTDAPKPFFHPVALPDGRTVTWDRPPDHPWHHGLWFHRDR